MSRAGVRRMTEVAVGLALVAVLHMIKLFQAPYGGSVTAGSMVPVIYLALRWGPKWGIISGLLASVIVYQLEPFFVHPLQAALDYPVAFGLLGIAGLFKGRPVVGTVVAGIARFLAHFASGVVFFASNAAERGMHPVAYSAAYNASYMLPEIVISAVLTVLVLRSLQRLEPVPR